MEKIVFLCLIVGAIMLLTNPYATARVLQRIPKRPRQ